MIKEKRGKFTQKYEDEKEAQNDVVIQDLQRFALKLFLEKFP